MDKEKIMEVIRRFFDKKDLSDEECFDICYSLSQEYYSSEDEDMDEDDETLDEEDDSEDEDDESDEEPEDEPIKKIPKDHKKGIKSLIKKPITKKTQKDIDEGNF